MTHEELINVCQAIGGVAESNGMFTAGLAVMLEDATIEDLTVGELLAAIAVRREQYNAMYGGTKS